MRSSPGALLPACVTDAFAPAKSPLRVQDVQDSLRMNNPRRQSPKDVPSSPETSSRQGLALHNQGRPGAVTARASRPRRSGSSTLRLSGQFLELTGTVSRQVPFASEGSATAVSMTTTAMTAGPSTAALDMAVPGMTAPGTASPDMVPLVKVMSRTDSLQLSVPKRLVRAAMRRNTVKRVLREAWRLAPDAALLQSGNRVWRFRLKAHPLGSLAAKSQYARAQMRLQARKAVWKAARNAQAPAMPQAAIQTTTQAGTQNGMQTGTPARDAVPSGKAGIPARAASQPSFADIKRQLRAEADRLLADAARRLKDFRTSPAGSLSSRSRA